MKFKIRNKKQKKKQEQPKKNHLVDKLNYAREKEKEIEKCWKETEKKNNGHKYVKVDLNRGSGKMRDE